MSELKPGDLALTLIELAEVPSMSCVELLEILPAGEPVSVKGVIRRFNADMYIVDYQGRLHGYSRKSLMPLRGDEQPHNEKASEVIN